MRHPNLLTANQLSRTDIQTILDHAAQFDTDNPTPLAHDDKLLALCFFEPSTRTKMSFDAAIKRLGGDSIDLGPVDSSSIAKGESLADTVRVVEGYADALVVRHPQQGSAQLVSEHVDVPVINGGDGAGHHPSQTLLDLYTIYDHTNLDDLSIGIMGDLKYGRTVHSLARALTNFDAHQHFISPESLRLPESVKHDLDATDTVVTEHESLDPVLDDLDVLYVTRIQRERFPDDEEYQRVAGEYQIDADTLTNARDDLAVMHPLPRVDEIAYDVDATAHAQYFTQAHNGVPVRMALLDLLFEHTDQ